MHENTVFDDSHSRALEASSAGVERPILIILDGGDLKHRYPLGEPEIAIGREVSCGIVLPDSKVSRKHAVVHYRNFNDPGAKPEVAIEDLKSTNGTFVNGERITERVLKDRDKVTIGSTIFGFFVRDETIIKADESLIKLASFDALTGLNNRGVFDMQIKREFDRARRYNRDLSLLLFDIDHFKKFNDTYGHQVGDLVLKELGHLVSHNFRSNDLSARYGGEEFAVVLPETSLENALIKAERLRKMIMNHSFSADSTRLAVTVSIGLATLEEGMEEPEHLIKAADDALYRAKGAGRNQVCWHSSKIQDIREASSW
jgi:two-component system cell cycle response regulator